MKKSKFRKVLATFMALAMFMTIALSVSTVSAATEGTDVVIHKIKMNDLSNHQVIPNPNGAEITDISSLGNGAAQLAGVKFNYYRVDGSALYEYGAIGDAALSAVPEATLAAAAGVVDMGSFITTATGYLISGLADGRYVFYEDSENGMVIDSLAVPFVLNLPVASRDAEGEVEYNQDGTVIYLESIHVYPKNQTQEPVATKYVNEIGDTVDSETMGEDITFYLTSTIPETIAQYDKFNFVDTLDSKLDFTGNLTVKLDGANLTGSTVATLPADYFDGAADYYAILPPSTGGGTLTVAFTQNGLDKLAAAVDSDTFQVSFTAAINESAILGEDITNEFRIDYTNSYDPETGEPDPKEEESNEVTVYTGGKAFIKTNDYVIEDINLRFLGGAQFALFVDTLGTGTGGTPVVWTQNLIDEMLPTGATFVDAGADGFLGDPIVFISAPTTGAFEIRGLKALVADGFDGKYYLMETVPPIGYIALNVPITFTVTKDAYDVQAPQQIKNAEMPDLPMTGGIGTIVFLVGGLLIMGGAVVTLRRKDRLER